MVFGNHVKTPVLQEKFLETQTHLLCIKHQEINFTKTKDSWLLHVPLNILRFIRQFKQTMLTYYYCYLKTNSNYPYYSQGIQYSQYYFFPKAIFMQYWTSIKIYYPHDKQIKQVNSCFDCQTFYENLWYSIYFYSNLGQFYNISKFYDISWFFWQCGSFAIIKEEYFGRTNIQLLFSRSFSWSQIAFQKFPGVFRSSSHPASAIVLLGKF